MIKPDYSEQDLLDSDDDLRHDKYLKIDDNIYEEMMMMCEAGIAPRSAFF